ncbi:MAG: hypothetical protein A3F16_06645 [Deltaproteobacteria bacterium RIFCSPHIGHO2_12_FULL_43_9]|nr:MAG: hypothetical protein A3F16_06645 [Deltaproteobacteria bacterium RIFCSPHIGHO2_12_FULL_43_9]
MIAITLSLVKNLIVLFYLVLIILVSPQGFAEQKPGAPKSWEEHAHLISRQLDLAFEQYKDGKLKEAKLAVLDAHFGSFESKSGMEMAINTNISAARKAEIEELFKNVRLAMANPPTDSSNLKKATEEIKTLQNALQHDALVLKKKKVSIIGWSKEDEEKEE